MSDSENEDLQELLACPGLYQEVPEQRKLINNKNALNNILEQLELNLPWIERLDLIAKPEKIKTTVDDGKNEKIVSSVDVNNDFERESWFYRQAQAGTLDAIKKLHSLGIATKRPTDFYAEMIKSDQHMNKISENLVAQKKRIELAERARQLREQRKFGKKTQIEVLNARKQEKKKLNEAIKTARKKSAKGQKFDLDTILNEIQIEADSKQCAIKRRDGSRNKTSETKQSGLDLHLSRLSKKRDYKNKRYGFGGQKKRSKWNTKESSENIHQFKVLTHQPTVGRIKALKKKMNKSKKKNQIKQKRQLSRMTS